MKKKFITNLALLIFLNLLVKPFWIFGIDRTVQNVVGAEEFGFYFSLLNFSYLLNIILDAGITNFNNRSIAQNRQLLSKYLSNIVVLKFFLAIVYFVVCIIAAFIVGYELKQFQLLLFLLFNQFLISFTLYLRSNIAGLHLFKTNSFISVLDRTLMILICCVLLWGNVTKSPFQIEWFVYAQTIAYVITLFVTFLIVLSKSEFLKLKYDRTFFIAILKQSFPFALLILLMTFYTRIDSVMLERILPNGEVQTGIYAQGFRIFDAAYQFALLFAVLLLPIFARMLKQKESVVQLVQLSFLLLIVPAIILAIASMFYSKEIMCLLYDEHTGLSSDFFGILMISFISISTTIIFGTLLTANGSMKELNIMAGITVIINIVLNFILIPRYYAFGAAVACLITQTFAALLQVLISKKIFHFNINLKLIFSLLFFVIGVGLISMFIKELIYNWIIGFIAIIVLSMIFAFIIKLFNLKALYQIVTSGDDE